MCVSMCVCVCGLGVCETVCPSFSVVTQEVAMLERSYSESLHRLLRSSSYTFHSNLLFQWLGNDPYVEIGCVVCCVSVCVYGELTFTRRLGELHECECVVSVCVW